MDSIKIDIDGVSKTLFLPLYSRAIESQTKDPIINDQKSVEIVNYLDKIFSKSSSKLHKMLFNRKLSKEYVVKIALRTKKFDEYVSDFLSKNPNGVIVNIGCGLDTRFYRIDNGKVEWYDIDLQQVIELKKHFLKENDRYYFISSSITDYSWMDMLYKNKGRPFMFIAEGVFRYLHETEVKSLVLELQKKFSGCELVFCTVSSYIKKLSNNGLVKLYFKHVLKMNKDVNINFGIAKSDELSSWNSGIELLNEWSFYDTYTDKLMFFKIDRFLESLRKTDWIVHYKLI